METTESLILSGKSSPLVLKNQISDWPANKWTPQYLANELSDKKYRCKIAPKTNSALWETECIHEEITLQQFVDWNDGKPRGDNPLNRYSRSDVSCYMDYKYMKDIFDVGSNHLKEVDWDTFGLEGRDGSDSTIWIGSAGCYTNCHYDTYGFNLVAQIYGWKRWILFPPSDSSNMYPTRIPYEESSVFSQVNVKQPDLDLHTRFQHCHPHVIELIPGDVLYVPRHWWHYVECLETSISINTWVEMDVDADSQVNEAITRLLFKCMVDMNLDDNENWINPGEELQDHAMNFVYLQDAWKQLNENIKTTENLQQSPTDNINKFANCVKLLQSETKTKYCEGEANDSTKQNLHGNGRKRKIISTSENIIKQKTLSCSENSNCKHKLLDTENIVVIQPVLFDTYLREIILCNKTIAQVDDADHSLKCEDIEYSKTCESCEDANGGVKGGTLEKSALDTKGEISDSGIVGSVNTDIKDGLTFKYFVQSLLHPEVIGKIKEVLTNQT